MSLYRSSFSIIFTRMHCMIQCVSRDMAIVLVCKICFRNKENVYVLTENKSFNFLRISHLIGVPSFYFEWLDHYIILITSVAKLLNIASIFLIYSFIICCSSYIVHTISCSGFGDVIVSWLFWLVIDCLFSVLVIEA